MGLEQAPIRQDARYALDTENTASPRAAVDDLELEPTQRVGDDEGLGRRESRDLAGRAAEEAPPTALSVWRRAY